MKSRKSAVLPLWLPILMSLAVALSACRKNPDSALGEDLGDRDFLTEHYQDTAFDIVVYTVPDTGIIIQNAARMLLGSVQDNVFGRSDYHVYSQLYYMGSNGGSSGFVSDSTGDRSIDSVILLLPYSTLYPAQAGATNGRPVHLSLHELTEGLLDSDDADSLYSISSEVAYKPEVLPGNAFTITPRPFDSIYDSLSGSTYVPALRVPLDLDFGLTIMTLPEETYGGDDAAMSRYFPGVCLRSRSAASEDESAVVSFAFASADETARIIVYHGALSEDEPRYDMFGFGPVRFTKVERDYTTSTDADFRSQMQGDSTAGRRAVYVGCSGGGYVGCVLPNVRELFAGRRIIINRAHLVLKAASAANGSGVEVPQALTVPNSLDAAYNEEGRWDADKKEYRLMLTRYLQRLFYEEAEPEPFYIQPNTIERYGTPRAVKLNGPSAENGSPMKLELIYTEVKE